MKRGIRSLNTYYKNVKKKKIWRSFLGNILLQNAIALVVCIVFKYFDEDVNIKAQFATSNFIALTIWLFNLFYSWED